MIIQLCGYGGLKGQFKENQEKEQPNHESPSHGVNFGTEKDCKRDWRRLDGECMKGTAATATSISTGGGIYWQRRLPAVDLLLGGRPIRLPSFERMFESILKPYVYKVCLR